jgi:hypothetical protein
MDNVMFIGVQNTQSMFLHEIEIFNVPQEC